MGRGLGFDALNDADADRETGGGRGLTLPPPKPREAPGPVPREALGHAGASLGFVSREPLAADGMPAGRGRGTTEAPTIAPEPDVAPLDDGMDAAPEPSKTVRSRAAKGHRAKASGAARAKAPEPTRAKAAEPARAKAAGDAVPSEATRLTGRRRVPQAKLLIAGRENVLDRFQQMCWRMDVPYWEGLERLMDRHAAAVESEAE